MAIEQVVDPAVSRAKFEREIAIYRGIERECQQRGWWLLRATYPEALVAFASPVLKPPAVLFGALFDFTNYDLWPPSVRIVNPFTSEPFRAKELPTDMPRRVPGPKPPEGSPAQVQTFEIAPLLQRYGPDDIPFVCLPGAREYHDHPAHSGDSWLLHRGRGEGTLHFFLEQFSKYGVEPIKAYNMGLQIAIRGFASAELPPE